MVSVFIVIDGNAEFNQLSSNYDAFTHTLRWECTINAENWRTLAVLIRKHLGEIPIESSPPREARNVLG